MNHFMIDLETMGLGVRPAIVAIGAVHMDERGLIQSAGFYRVVDLQSNIDAGLRMDASTVEWWLQQSDEARAALLVAERVPLREALSDLSDWVTDQLDLSTPDGVWGNEVASDNVWLASAYAAIGSPRPWPHTADRCYRTFRAQHSDVPARATPPGTVEHNALHDAYYQAQHMADICAAKDISFT